ncbi:MAG: hypothetical protein HZC55_06065 [Verrucomicrobia bacterium]|nr:hypothetical protein [Verrucomicrobiota bacterium]
MTQHLLFRLGFAGGSLLLASFAFGAGKPASDLQPPNQRQATVDLALQLVKRAPPGPLPADMPSPFNPADFDKHDPAEGPAAAGPKPAGPAGGGGPAPSAAAPAQPAGPATDRETLEMLASQITPSGMIMLRGTPRLIFANKPFEVGTRFTASYNNQDYELELVAIDRTTFTLRYRGEEVTRPIRPVR